MPIASSGGGSILPSKVKIAAVVVLAAGQSKRMLSHKCKIVHPIAGRPIIHYILEVASSVSSSTVIMVESPKNDSPGFPGVLSVTQEKPCGTGDAFACGFLALEKMIPEVEGDILVLLGDTPLITYNTLDLLFQARLNAPDSGGVVMGMRPSNPFSYGRLMCCPQGKIRAIVEEKNATEEERRVGLCNSSVMVIARDVARAFVETMEKDTLSGEFYLTDVVAKARTMGREMIAVEGPWQELVGINTRADLAEAERLMQERLRHRALTEGATLVDPKSTFFAFDTVIQADVTIEPFVRIGPGVTLCSGCLVRSFSYIENATLKKGCVVGPFAHLRGNSVLEENSCVGNFVEVKGSIVGRESKAKHLAYIGDASLGTDVTIGAGTVIVNYDGHEKFRSTLGNDVLVGCNSTLISPITLGNHVTIGAGSVITESIPDASLSLSRAPQKILPLSQTSKHLRRKRKSLLNPSLPEDLAL